MKLVFITFVLLTSLTAFAGTVDGGGGNLRPLNPTPVSTFQHLEKKGLQPYLAMIFFNLERNSQGIKEAPPTIEGWTFDEARAQYLMKFKLTGKPSIYEKIQTVKWNFKYDGPCYDQQGKEMDGSAGVDDPNTVCLSIQRIAPKLAEDKYLAPFLALAAHEVSHLLGATELEAESLQYTIESEIYGKFYSGQLDTYLMAFESGVSSLNKTLKSILPTSGEAVNGVTLEYCLSLAEMGSQVQSLALQIEQLHGYSPFSLDQLKDFGALKTQSLNLIQYCKNDQAPAKLQYKELFKGKPVRKFRIDMQLDDERETNYLAYGDKVAFQKELQAVAASVQNIQKRFYSQNLNK